jgi:putative selenium metabolism hydrolase
MSKKRPNTTLPADPVQLCQELVRIPSLPGEEGAVADWVIAKMSQFGFDNIQRDELGSVTGIWQGKNNGPTLLFDAHMDVVPVDQPQHWRHTPFGGELEDGKVWGRGAADTKASLASMLAALSSLQRSNLCGRVVLAASVHEEIFTGLAVSKILERFSPDIFVTGEPTDLDIAIAQKGRVSLELSTTGVGAHTSQPELGVNAVYKMIKVIQRLRSIPVRSDPDLGKEILELTEISSLPFPNPGKVPHACKARMIGRILPQETREGFLDRIQTGLADITGINVSIATVSGICYTGVKLVTEDFLSGWRNRSDDLWGKKILTALAAEGLPANTYGSGCGTNASAAGSRGIPAFIYGPGSLNQAHIVDEWVSVEDLHLAVRGFRAIASACLNERSD